MMPRILTALSAFLFTVIPAVAQEPLTTPWTPDAETPLPEYPRPQLERAEWTNLNGGWDYAIRPAADESMPTQWDGEIRVPFPIESRLSGVQKSLKPDEALWYHRRFEAAAPDGGRLMLHFGGVDWRTTVWVNGTRVGEHEGGFDPFSFDITDAVGDDASADLVVRVWDPTDEGDQPRGKQVLNPHGIWYTAVSGIWQTVWLEPLSEVHVIDPGITADRESGGVVIQPRLSNWEPGTLINIFVYHEGERVAMGSTNTPEGVRLRIRDPQDWSPDSPTLYQVVIIVRHKGDEVDRVKSYFAFRDIALGKDEAGVTRLLLNGEPLFQFGPLDQGWWPDGLYTAPSDEALRYDIEITKALGFNMARKHVKVEPARWYYWADTLGLLVWQDMPSGDDYIGPSDPDIARSPESEAVYRKEWRAIIDSLRHFPSVVVWVPFNEGWGQFKTNEILEWTKTLDPTRLVDGPSGWADRGGGDMHDLHMYPGPGMFPIEEERASVLGEFGGLGLPVTGHLWQDKDNWGYRTYRTTEELKENYARLVENMRPLIGRGLAAAVYTQTTDVEGEVNGLLTYDRKVVKLEPEWIAAVNARAFGPVPTEHTVVATSEREKAVWRYINTDPGEGWPRPDFDDSAWKTGKGGFGTRGTPGAVIGTEWNSPEIWIRRAFTLDAVPERGDIYLRMGHDEDAQVFINGEPVVETTGWTDGYRMIGPIDRGVLKTGENIIAAHCSQTSGGQFIDIGIVQLLEPE